MCGTMGFEGRAVPSGQIENEVQVVVSLCGSKDFEGSAVPSDPLGSEQLVWHEGF